MAGIDEGSAQRRSMLGIRGTLRDSESDGFRRPGEAVEVPEAVSEKLQPFELVC